MIKLLKHAALAATFALSTLSTAMAADFDVTFLLVNDIYKMHDTTRGGVARANAVARAEREKGGNLVYVHAGDTISPSLLSGFDKGEHMVELLNVVPLDIFIPGNHEFDFGPRFRSEVHHRQALFEMRAQARMKKGPGGENFDRRSLR